MFRGTPVVVRLLPPQTEHRMKVRWPLQLAEGAHTVCPDSGETDQAVSPNPSNPSCSRIDGDGASWFRGSAKRSLKHPLSCSVALTDRWARKDDEPACLLLYPRFSWPHDGPEFKRAAAALTRRLQRSWERLSRVRSCISGKPRSSNKLLLAIA